MTMSTKTTLAILAAHLGVLVQSTVVVDALTRGDAGAFVAAPVRRFSETCAEAVVHCKNGFAYTDATFMTRVVSKKTCVEECDGKCCVEGACSKDYEGDKGVFTVCADGSCNGTQACYGAGSSINISAISSAIGLIAGGSCVGEKACYFAGAYESSVGDITNGSCVNTKACAYLGRYGGKVGDITGGSCDGNKACYFAGSGGSVGDITNGSCVDDEACIYIGQYGGEVGDITNGSCDGNKACYKAGYFGNVGSITNGSCFGPSACRYLGCFNTTFGSSLESCCKGENTCQSVGCNGDGQTDCTTPPPDLPITCSKPPDSLSDAPSVVLTTAPSALPSEAPSFLPTTPPNDSPPSLPGCVPKVRFNDNCEEKNKKRNCAKELLCKWKNKQCVPICDNKRKQACRKPRFKNSRVCKFN